MPEHGVVVFESHHAPGFVGELVDDFAKFLLVIAGDAHWTAPRQEIRLGPGTLCHVPARLPHRQVDLPGHPVALYALHYRPALLPAVVAERLTAAGLLPLALDASDQGRMRHVRALFQELLFEQDLRQDGWQALMQARLLELAVLGVRLGPAAAAAAARSAPAPAGAGGHARVSAYLRQLRSTFFLAQTIDEAAQAVQLSRRQFTTVFRAVSGESWRQHLLRLRLEHAQRLLVDSTRSITAVAFASGFEDLSHFHHAFKSANGQTPGDYRERHRPRPQ
jgi:AraC family L-rhamnose operon regulatory protein RhaS